MGKCDRCGNDYDKSFEVIMNGNSYTFDSFECAVNQLAPRCKKCGNLVIGHGMEDDGIIYCCANCAAEDGKGQFVDRTV
jgi:hypothetical protein